MANKRKQFKHYRYIHSFDIFYLPFFVFVRVYVKTPRINNILSALPKRRQKVPSLYPVYPITKFTLPNYTSSKVNLAIVCNVRESLDMSGRNNDIVKLCCLPIFYEWLVIINFKFRS